MIRFIKRKSTGVMAEIFNTITPEEMQITGNKMLVAANIADLMESKGWTPAQFAEKFPKTEDEILQWLEGQTDFDIDTLTQISLVLGVDIQRLFAPVQDTKPKKNKRMSNKKLVLAE